jgi:hypothetical protein
MKWTSLLTKFREWKQGISDILEYGMTDPIKQRPELYTGLVVSPSSFSKQLGDLQVSLQRANAPQPHKMEPEILRQIEVSRRS